METTTNALTLVGTLLVLGAVFILSMYFRSWQYTRKSREVIDILIRNGATDADSARPLREMGLTLSSSMVGFRNYRAEALRSLVQNGYVQVTEDQRFFLTPEAYRTYVSGRNFQ